MYMHRILHPLALGGWRPSDARNSNLVAAAQTFRGAVESTTTARRHPLLCQRALTSRPRRVPKDSLRRFSEKIKPWSFVEAPNRLM